jgi:antitoxin (DNA-binding transcriptional repressor) of toxin-antitoxin stability system
MSGVQIPHARLINTKTMEIYTVQEFQERWEEMIERVENGERIGIINENGNTAVMVPADDELIRIYTELNNEAP